MTKKILLLLAMTAFIGQWAFAAETKIGYVDLQKAITKTSEGKNAKKKLEKEFKKKQADLQKKEADLKSMTKDLEKKSLVLSDDVKLKKQRTLQEEVLKYRELVGKSQMEIQQKERDLTMPIINKLRTIIGEIASKEGYTMILEKSEQSVLWAKSDADLTEKIVKEFEKRK